MIEQHYAGVIANWDGKQVPAEDQIRAAREHRTCESAPTRAQDCARPVGR